MNYTIPASVSATDAGDVSITAASVTEVYYMGTELTGSPEDRVNANADGAYVLERKDITGLGMQLQMPVETKQV